MKVPNDCWYRTPSSDTRKKRWEMSFRPTVAVCVPSGIASRRGVRSFLLTPLRKRVSCGLTNSVSENFHIRVFDHDLLFQITFEEDGHGQIFAGALFLDDFADPEAVVINSDSDLEQLFRGCILL